MSIRDEAFQGLPVSAPVIDAHTHLGPHYGTLGFYESPRLVSNSAVVSMMDRLGVDCIVTAPHMIVAGMMEAANTYAASAAAEFPGRIYGYISVCPGEGLDAVRAELRRYEQHPAFVGLKFLPGYHGQLAQDEYQYAADFAEDHACALLVHTWGGNPPLPDIADMAARRPHLRLLCAHQGGGYAHLTRQLAEFMKNLPNLYLEICGSLDNTLSIEDMVELAGEDRVIYGSDFINLDIRYDFGRVVLSTLPDEVKRKVLSENYLALLRESRMGKIGAAPVSG